MYFVLLCIFKSLGMSVIENEFGPHTGMSIDTLALAERAMQEKISIAPGMMFSVSDQYTHFLRMCTGFHWSDAAEQGVKRLGEMIEEMRDDMQ